jgi:hypothetical protein
MYVGGLVLVFGGVAGVGDPFEEEGGGLGFVGGKFEEIAEEGGFWGVGRRETDLGLVDCKFY